MNWLCVFSVWGMILAAGAKLKVTMFADSVLLHSMSHKSLVVKWFEVNVGEANVILEKVVPAVWHEQMALNCRKVAQQKSFKICFSQCFNMKVSLKYRLENTGFTCSPLSCLNFPIINWWICKSHTYGTEITRSVKKSQRPKWQIQMKLMNLLLNQCNYSVA